ncbi:MAG: translation initiation factor IF-1 [Candidatus Blackburnbacteria bacterium RIFCSPHIGHO2_01_FULL_44_64]|uniref:Translation initiation factor IF-1 n=1 Tax=Candidatus Blackburnbacteria bacterium RIFCSPHIGHO2_02_FULL_44_20 TaxID=1797516 RepID=A0A1G1VAS3_9BACT|nr:MAG: translation initiation factor IF-1 [Candidatus Blackburnbacteria bacterium RIFCSPHIGHO2_01_FULL_44_64]OGY11828.1 MAG: translation initiation factor IF-1 [Candidatus Blackburnbacteria bacterium RIFCSPHIGHO2_12_FULL_44_25]OGY12367.1 MAG: translation initiation factor IF-1 [Candidatus Blackburnbacteria bacterium RIFCSPHIGHO2_02_FULL_44_20]OGY15072.1 MAG: translation initiation factor IF-1 [Candidatus Blackburnbacteria bacterium RIFCSPLOWO2_01_FULL_44_43]OGY16011.1 MAG: translation initiati
MENQDENQEVAGIVLESLPNTMFKIQLDDGRTVIATVAGKMRRNFIRILPGDRVRVKMTPYDDARGRVVWREK